MLLATLDVLRPVAAVGVLVVQQPADAQLLGGRSVPARPVPGAGRLVAKDAVQPVAVLRRDGAILGERGVGREKNVSLLYLFGENKLGIIMRFINHTVIAAEFYPFGNGFVARQERFI